MSGKSPIPTIGITLPCRAADSKERRRDDRAAAQYRAALEAHGARVVELRPQAGPLALDGLDGIVLTGGGDIAPALYGQRPHAKSRTPDPERDALEMAVTKEALAAGLPVLGVCRGAQVLGVALGGQLVQDIDSEIQGAQRHSLDATARPAGHGVEIAEGSLLSQIVSAGRMRVNSFHHQANGQLGAGVRRAAWSADSVTEAVESERGDFVIGVQWHPERMWRRSPRQRRIFSRFVAAAAGHRAARRAAEGLR